MHMHNELKVEKKYKCLVILFWIMHPSAKLGGFYFPKKLHLFLVLAHCVYGVCFALSDEIKKRIFDVDVALLQCYVCKLFKKNCLKHLTCVCNLLHIPIVNIYITYYCLT